MQETANIQGLAFLIHDKLNIQGIVKLHNIKLDNLPLKIERLKNLFIKSKIKEDIHKQNKK